MLHRQSCLALALSALATLITLRGQTAPVPAATTSAVLEGRVVDAITGAPVAGAQLRMVPVHNTFSPDTESPEVRYEQADEQGHFEFVGLAPEYYNLGVRAAGYRASYAQGGTGISLQGPNQIVSGSCSRCAVVNEDGHRMDEAGVLHASVTVRLMPEIVIAGKVTDPLGNAMPGARIFGIKAEGGEGGAQAITRGRRGPRLEAYADDRGEFRLAHLEEGRYYLAVSQGQLNSPYWSQSYHITYFPHALDPNQAQAVAPVPGKAVRADIQFARNAGVKVSGRVIPPPSWTCPANARCYSEVGLTPWPVTELNEIGWPRRNAAQADNGFEILDVLPGTYTLQAVTKADRMDEPSGGEREAIHGTFRRIEVGAGGLGPIDLEVKPLNGIAGSISFAEGCPHTGLRISVGQEPVVFSRSVDVLVPAGETTFTLTGMGPGRLTLGLMSFEIGAEQLRLESARLGDQEVSKSGFDYPTGGASALQIRVGCSSQGGTVQ